MNGFQSLGGRISLGNLQNLIGLQIFREQPEVSALASMQAGSSSGQSVTAASRS
jgi:hypothetical protein